MKQWQTFKSSYQFILIVIVGFALFKTVQIITYSTAMASERETFVMVSNIMFNIFVSVPIILAEATIALLAICGRLPSWKIPVLIPSIVLIVVNFCSLFGVLNFFPAPVKMVIICGAYGAGSVLVMLAWVEVLTAMDPSDSMKALAFGMLLSALLTIALKQISSVALSCILAVFVLASLFLLARARALIPQEEKPPPSLNTIKNYKQGFMEISDGLVSLFALGCAVGVFNSFLLVSNYTFEGSDIISNVGLFIAQIIFCVAAFVLPRLLNIGVVYRIIFPILTLLLILWPFLGRPYSGFFSIVLSINYNLVAVSVMYLIIREANIRSLNPYVFMGISIVFIRLFALIGLIIGSQLAGNSGLDETVNTILMVVIVIYVLSLVLVFISRTKKRTNTQRETIPSDDDSFYARSLVLKEQYRLTDRETDILLYLARGRSSTYIGDTLYLSSNTVRGHIKNIYVKLSVHSKQELIDLFAEGTP